MGTSRCIGASGQIKFRNQMEKHTVHVLLEEGLDFRGSRAEGSGLAPVGSTVCKWGTNKIRVAVKLETSGTWFGREAGPREGLLQYQDRGVPPPCE